MKTTILTLTMLLATSSLWAAGDKYNYEPKVPRVERAAKPILAKNLFRGAKVTASGKWETNAPKLAVDGDKSIKSHWACEGMPCWLTVEMKQAAELGAIPFTPYWSGRYYQYIIEGSLDGKTWTMLVDQSSNTQIPTASGLVFRFKKPQSAKFVRVTFSKNSVGNERGGHIVEIEGIAANDPVLKKSTVSSWAAVTPGLHGAASTIDQRHTKWDVPQADESKRTLKLTGWRGERVAGHVVVWSAEKMNQLRAIATDAIGVAPAVNLVRFVYGAHKAKYKGLYADILDTAPEINAEARTARSVWYSVDIPVDAKAGLHQATLTVRAAGMKPVVVNVEIDVIGMTLPTPDKWTFHLDLWQHPWAIARGHNVEMFSKEFYAVAKPLFQRLAGAGQKCLTVSINDRPWNQQTYDAYGTMIEWIKQPGGTWKYDYTKFDEYVKFGEECGIASQINCYSMVPWGNVFHYLDGATGDRKSFSARPGTKEYTAFWTPFLKDFAKHLKKTGRLKKTGIAMDERHLNDLLEVIKLVKAHAPELKIALAANKNLEAVAPSTFDYCFSIGTARKIGAKFTTPRRAKGQKTTFYVCCGPMRPNTFPFSPPAESAWLSWYASARQFDGFLRWAYAHWNRNPLETTDYGNWPTGDAWFVYPGNRSSIRFERLRDGIQDFEKLRIVRAALVEKGDSKSIKTIDKMLERFNKVPSPAQVAIDVNAAKKLLNTLSRTLTQ